MVAPVSQQSNGSACLVCGNAGTDLYRGLKLCTTCRFAWADVNLSSEDWQSLYEKNYFFGEEYADYVREEDALRKNFRRDLTWMSTHHADGQLLEIGCAYGFFLDEARSRYTVTGVDIHKDGCEYAARRFGVPARHGDFLSMPLDERSFDVITLWDVLEHLPRPDFFLNRCSSLLKKDGHLFFSTLDRESWLARLQGRRWRQIHPPTHVSYFSWTSLQKLLTQSGLEVVDRKYFGLHRSWDNTLYTLLALRGRQPHVYRALKTRGWLRGTYYLNTFDHVHCAAVKKGSSS